MAAAYMTDSGTFEALKRINKRLFSDRALIGDDRRDLANLMFVLLDDAHFFPVTSARDVQLGSQANGTE